jgi:hypothetical protein
MQSVADYGPFRSSIHKTVVLTNSSRKSLLNTKVVLDTLIIYMNAQKPVSFSASLLSIHHWCRYAAPVKSAKCFGLMDVAKNR